MEITIQNISVLIAISLTGLVAGLCFTWSNAVVPGIGSLDDLSFLRAFQEMNRSIINPLFLIVFFGPFIVHVANIYLHRNSDSRTFWFFVLAAILFIIGVVLVTIFKNVPLNEMLDNTDLVSSTKEELHQLRNIFEKPWKQWHMVRSISAVLSFLLLVTALIFSQKIV